MESEETDAARLNDVPKDLSAQVLAALVNEYRSNWEDVRTERLYRQVKLVRSHSELVEKCGPGEYYCDMIPETVSTLPQAWVEQARDQGVELVDDTGGFDRKAVYVAVVSARSNAATVVGALFNTAWMSEYAISCSEAECSVARQTARCNVKEGAREPLTPIREVLNLVVSSCGSGLAGR